MEKWFFRGKNQKLSTITAILSLVLMASLVVIFYCFSSPLGTTLLNFWVCEVIPKKQLLTKTY